MLVMKEKGSIPNNEKKTGTENHRKGPADSKERVLCFGVTLFGLICCVPMARQQGS